MLSASGSVLSMTPDRLPELSDAERIPFDAARWHSGPTRFEMVADVIAREDQLRDRQAVVELLGEPDGVRSLGTPQWELKVNCGYFNQLDVFVYWPTGEYPEYLYGGTTERIGEWAYASPSMSSPPITRVNVPLP